MMNRAQFCLTPIVLMFVSTPLFAQYPRGRLPPQPMYSWSAEKTEKYLLEKGINSTPFSKPSAVARQRHGGKAGEFINEFGQEGGEALSMLSKKSAIRLFEMDGELQKVSRVADLLTLIALHSKRERIVDVMWKFRESLSRTKIVEAFLADPNAVLLLGRSATREEIEKVYEDSQKSTLELLLDP